jgi:hypothetical protein
VVEGYLVAEERDPNEDEHERRLGDVRRQTEHVTDRTEAAKQKRSSRPEGRENRACAAEEGFRVRRRVRHFTHDARAEAYVEKPHKRSAGQSDDEDAVSLGPKAVQKDRDDREAN